VGVTLQTFKPSVVSLLFIGAALLIPIYNTKQHSGYKWHNTAEMETHMYMKQQGTEIETEEEEVEAEAETKEEEEEEMEVEAETEEETEEAEETVTVEETGNSS
jgi:hypothetical protein